MEETDELEELEGIQEMTKEQEREIIMLYNHLFSIESKTTMLKLIYPSTTEFLNKNRNNIVAINELFDTAFSIEDKITGIQVNYEVKGLKVKTLKELLENKKLLEENEICTNWKMSRERRKRKPSF